MENTRSVQALLFLLQCLFYRGDKATSFIERLNTCNHFNRQTVVPFLIGHQQVGWIKKSHCSWLQDKTDYFQLKADQICLSDHFENYEERTAAIAEVVSYLREKEAVSDWRSKLYPVAPAYGQKPLLALERSIAPFFGIKTYGTHLNGYYEKDNQIWVWVAQRASHLKFAPDKLDNLAAGGLILGLSAQENMHKEACEEAQIPADLLSTMQAAGAVSYLMDTPRGITPDTMLVYDLKLPPNFAPTTDGAEVSHFMTFSLAELAQRVYDTDDFKYNSALVMMDFLIRHGAISSDHPEYLETVTALRRPLFARECDLARWFRPSNAIH